MARQSKGNVILNEVKDLLFSEIVGCAPRTRIDVGPIRRASCPDVTMSQYRRSNVGGAAYFFTVNTYVRQPILTHPDVRATLREAIEHVRESLPFTIDAWVLMPDHLHAIWALPQNDAAYDKRWGMIKAHVSRRCEHLLERDEVRRFHPTSSRGKPIFGHDAFGSIKFAMTAISNVVSIASITIRSNISWLSEWRSGHIQRFTVLSVVAYMRTIGAPIREWSAPMRGNEAACAMRTLRLLTLPLLRGRAWKSRVTPLTLNV